MRLALLSLLLCLCVPATAMGAVWSGPLSLDPSGVRGSHWDNTSLESNDANAVLAAWGGPHFTRRPSGSGYVSAAYRTPRAGFSERQVVATEGELVDAALNAGGDGVILVDNAARAPYEQYLVFVDEEGRFSAPEYIAREVDEFRGRPQAVGMDDAGNVVVLWDRGYEGGFSLTVRTFAGEYATRHRDYAQGLSLRGRPEFRMNGAGQINVIFNTSANPDGTGAQRVYETSGTIEGFGVPQPISDAVESPDFAFPPPAVVRNARGDAALLWNGTVRVKPAGGGWGPAEAVEGAEPGRTVLTASARVAIDEEGNLFAAWPEGHTLGRYRPAGGKFGALEVLGRKPHDASPWHIWFDQDENLLHAYSPYPDGGLEVSTRPPDGSAGAPHVLQAGGARQPYEILGSVPVEDGLDLVAWSPGVRGWTGAGPADKSLRVSVYKPMPIQPTPVVSAVKARPDGLSVKVSERAVVDVLAEKYRPNRLSGKRVLRFTREVTRGRSTLAISSRAARKLRKAGPVRVFVAATDRQGRRSREAQLVLRPAGP